MPVTSESCAETKIGLPRAR